MTAGFQRQVARLARAGEIGAIDAPARRFPLLQRLAGFGINLERGGIAGRYLGGSDEPGAIAVSDAAAMQGFGFDAGDHRAGFRIDGENLVGIFLVQNPQIAIGGELQIVGLIDRRLGVEQLVYFFSDHRRVLARGDGGFGNDGIGGEGEAGDQRAACCEPACCQKLAARNFHLTEVLFYGFYLRQNRRVS